MPCCFHAARPSPFEHFDPGCPLNIPDSELVEFPKSSGNQWCRFHLPLNGHNGVGSPKMRWSEKGSEDFNLEIIREIERARESNKAADLSGVVFPEYNFFTLDFSFNRNWPAISFSGASFPSFDLLGNAQFSEISFDHDVTFKNAQFNGAAWFSRSKFGAASFDGARFEQGVSFRGASFSGYASFVGVTFMCAASFHETYFGGNFIFNQVSVAGKAAFSGSRSVSNDAKE